MGYVSVKDTFVFLQKRPIGQVFELSSKIPIQEEFQDVEVEVQAPYLEPPRAEVKKQIQIPQIFKWESINVNEKQESEQIQEKLEQQESNKVKENSQSNQGEEIDLQSLPSRTGEKLNSQFTQITRAYILQEVITKRRSFIEVAKELGISASSVYQYRQKYQNGLMLMNGTPTHNGGSGNRFIDNGEQAYERMQEAQSKKINTYSIHMQLFHERRVGHNKEQSDRIQRGCVFVTKYFQRNNHNGYQKQIMLDRQKNILSAFAKKYAQIKRENGIRYDNKVIKDEEQKFGDQLNLSFSWSEEEKQNLMELMIQFKDDFLMIPERIFKNKNRKQIMLKIQSLKRQFFVKEGKRLNLSNQNDIDKFQNMHRRYNYKLTKVKIGWKYHEIQKLIQLIIQYGCNYNQISDEFGHSKTKMQITQKIISIKGNQNKRNSYELEFPQLKEALLRQPPEHLIGTARSYIKRIPCPICGNDYYDRKGGFVQHMQRHAKVGDQFKCMVCHKTFIGKISRKMHMGKHTTEEISKFAPKKRELRIINKNKETKIDEKQKQEDKSENLLLSVESQELDRFIDEAPKMPQKLLKTQKQADQVENQPSNTTQNNYERVINESMPFLDGILSIDKFIEPCLNDGQNETLDKKNLKQNQCKNLQDKNQDNNQEKYYKVITPIEYIKNENLTANFRHQKQENKLTVLNVLSETQNTINQEEQKYKKQAQIEEKSIIRKHQQQQQNKIREIKLMKRNIGFVAKWLSLFIKEIKG